MSGALIAGYCGPLVRWVVSWGYVKADLFSPAQLQELEQLKRGVGFAQPETDRVGATTELLDEVRRLGHYPKETRANPSESKLARKLRNALNDKCFNQAQREELQQLREQSVHPREKARSMELLQSAEESPDPMEGFAVFE